MKSSLSTRSAREISGLEQTLTGHVQILATTFQRQTVMGYGTAVNHFLTYLRANFPHVCRLSQLRRDPHLLGWFRWLCEQDDPPLSSATRRRYLIQLRRLFYEVADNGHCLPSGLILS